MPFESDKSILNHRQQHRIIAPPTYSFQQTYADTKTVYTPPIMHIDSDISAANILSNNNDNVINKFCEPIRTYEPINNNNNIMDCMQQLQPFQQAQLIKPTTESGVRFSQFMFRNMF